MAFFFLYKGKASIQLICMLDVLITWAEMTLVRKEGESEIES